MTDASWYNSGFNGMQREQERLDSQHGPRRFYIPAGQEKEVVFVDDDPFCIYEHNPKIDGNFRNWLTCLSGTPQDPVCCKTLGSKTRYYCGYLTIVDCSVWEDQRGNSHQYEMRLLQAKMKTLKKFRRKKESKGSLVSQLYMAVREDDKSPSCGDEFEHTREVEMTKLFELTCYQGVKLSEMWDEAEAKEDSMKRVLRTFAVEPDEDGKLPRTIPRFNYFELLKPQDSEELAIALGAAEKSTNDFNDRRPSKSGGGGASNSNATKSDDVPF
jgi:hypothetical protein